VQQLLLLAVLLHLVLQQKLLLAMILAFQVVQKILLLIPIGKPVYFLKTKGFSGNREAFLI
jgi:hypothetical protein